MVSPTIDPISPTVPPIPDQPMPVYDPKADAMVLVKDGIKYVQLAYAYAQKSKWDWKQMLAAVVAVVMTIATGTFAANKLSGPTTTSVAPSDAKGADSKGSAKTDTPPTPDVIEQKMLDKLDLIASKIDSGNKNIIERLDKKPKPPTPPNPPSPIDPISGTISLPATMSADVGRMVKLTVTVQSGDFNWVIPPETASALDYHITGSSVLFTPLVDGACEIGAIAVSKDATPLWCKITSGKGPQPPPVPIPTPTDPFLVAIQAAYTADGKPSAQVAQLASVYKLSPTFINDPANKTPVDILNVLKKSVVLVLKEANPDVMTVLKNTRLAIATEMDKTLPLGANSTKALDAPTRQLIATQFARVQAALETLK